MATLTFDDINKIITVDAPDIEITIQELHNAIVEWEDELENMDIDRVVESTGKEPLGGGVSVGITLVLLNNWRLAFEARPGPTWVQCRVSGGNTVGSHPDGPVYQTAFVQVLITASSSATTADLEAIQFSSYGGGVSLDVNSANSGTAYPNGNQEFPVNNLADAVVIANDKGFSTIFVRSSMTLSSEIVSQFTFIGKSHVLTEITIDTTLVCDGVTFDNCNITGVLDGGAHVVRCEVGDLSYVNGHVHSSGIYGTITLAGSEDAVFVNCLQVGTSTPIINMGGSGQNLSVTEYSGQLTITNFAGFANVAAIGMSSGNLILDSTITAGGLIVAGVGVLTNNATSVTFLDVNGLMSKETVADAVLNTSLITYTDPDTVAASLRLTAFGDRVTIDTVNGSAGTAYPLGTEASPVDNLTDAVIIATFYSFTELHFESDYTFPNTTFITGYTLTGSGMQDTTFTFVTGSIVGNCKIDNAKCTGTFDGVIGFKDTWIYDVGSVGVVPSSQEIIIQNCLLQGVLSIPSNYSGIVTILDCWATPDGTNPPILNMGGAGFDIQVRNLSGFMKLINCTTASDIRIFLNSGGVELDSTVTAGNFVFTGVGNLVNNATSVTSLDTNGLMSKKTITEITWDIVYVNVDAGVSGTAFPIGTPTSPVDNIADAKIIADAQNISSFHIHGSVTITGDWSNYIFESKSYEIGRVTCSDAILTHTVFRSIRLLGSASVSTGEFTCNNVTFTAGFTNLYATLDMCTMTGSFTVLSTGYVRGNNCNTTGAGITVDCNASGGVQLGNFSGVVTFSNFSTPGGFVAVAGLFQCTLENTLTAGLGLFSGIGTLLDNSGPGFFMNKLLLPSATWDEVTSVHTTTGTTGNAQHVINDGVQKASILVPHNTDV